MAWLITGQKFQEFELKLKAFILTFRDPSSHLCQNNMRVAVSTDFGVGEFLQVMCFCSNPIFLRVFEKWDPGKGWAFSKPHVLEGDLKIGNPKISE